MFTQSFHCLLNLDRCLWMRFAFSNIVNDDVRDGGLVVLSTFTSSRALEWVLHSDGLLFTVLLHWFSFFLTCIIPCPSCFQLKFVKAPYRFIWCAARMNYRKFDKIKFVKSMNFTSQCEVYMYSKTSQGLHNLFQEMHIV
jgi:hypothetical protein